MKVLGATFSTLLALVLTTPAQAQQLPERPLVTVLLPQTSGAPPAKVRRSFEAALEGDGAAVVPPVDIHSPVTPPDLYRDLKMNAIAELRIAPLPKRPKQRKTRYEAQLRVLDPDGTTLATRTLTLTGRGLTPGEAHELADMTVGAASVPRPAPAVPPAPVARNPVAPAPLVQQEPLPILQSPNPLPTKQRLFVLSADGSLTWRRAQANAPAPGQSLDFSSSTPYAGFGLGAEALPFLSGAWQYIGFDAAYSFSYARINATSGATGVPTIGLSATENRLNFDVIGHSPFSLLGGDLNLQAGLAYEGFITSQNVGSLVSSSHFSPRFGLGYRVPLVASLSLDLGFGYRPWVHVGSDLTQTFGNKESSFGIDAHAALTGSLEPLLHNLRWVVGYDFLRYSDSYGQSGAAGSTFSENYNRLSLGLAYRL